MEPQSKFIPDPLPESLSGEIVGTTHEQAGEDYEAFLKLFSRDRYRVYSYIYSLVPHHNDAEDLFQQCSVLLWRKFSQFDRSKSFLAWAYGVAHNEVRNFMRSPHRNSLQLRDELLGQLAEDRLAEMEIASHRLDALRECMKRLGFREQELVQAAYGHEDSLKKYAEATGQVIQTLYNRLGKIRRTLLECVERRLMNIGGET
jgi:RNA polymerase sigma-70 factor (ECF subfamily)